MTKAFAGYAFLAVITLFAASASAQQPTAEPPTTSTFALQDIHVHDPWILADQPSHTYYLYTASRNSLSPDHRSGVIAYESTDLKTWTGPKLVFEVPSDSWADPTAGIWAPEVHAYKGRYYLFATLNNYKASLPSNGAASKPKGVGTDIQVLYNGVGPHPRGTEVFVSDSPLGPFKVIVDKPIPPADYMTLDGTFYVEDGIPYMVYAHEWTQLVDGSMEAIQMAPDLSASVGKPFYLFKASDAPWLADRRDTQNSPQNYVTDGPEMFRTRKGALLMLWSSYRDGLYVETLAHSVSGRLNGPWRQDGVLVGNDSGHGMIFKTFDGRLMLVLHHPFDGRLSKAKLYEIEDTGKTIRVKAEVGND
jgi:hypothetical protein